MASKILYNTTDNSILRCQPKPKGSASLPSFEALCKSARVPESQKENLDTITINEDHLTKQAQSKLRIINKKAIKKPKAIISSDNHKIKAESSILLSIKIINTIESDNFSEIKMKINDIEFTVIIENNQGSKEIELQEPDIYQINCIDHRFISQPVKVEVV